MTTYPFQISLFVFAIDIMCAYCQVKKWILNTIQVTFTFLRTNFKLALGEKKHFGAHLIAKLHFVCISINLNLQFSRNVMHLALKITWCDLPLSFSVGRRLCTCFSSWCPQWPVCPSRPPKNPLIQRLFRSSPSNPWLMQTAASTMGMRRRQELLAISSNSTNWVDFHLKFFLEICHEADIGHERYAAPTAVSVSVCRVAMLWIGGFRVLFLRGTKDFLFTKAT